MSLLNQILQHLGTYAIKSRGTSNGWNYTLYQDKWIEADITVQMGSTTATVLTVNTPFTMANTTYKVQATPNTNYLAIAKYGIADSGSNDSKAYTYFQVACSKSSNYAPKFDIHLAGYIA